MNNFLNRLCNFIAIKFSNSSIQVPAQFFADVYRKLILGQKIIYAQ